MALAAPASDDPWRGIHTEASELIEKIEAQWPIHGLAELGQQSENFKLEAISNPHDPLAIGALQMVTIKAPLATVAAMVDNFAAYVKIFDGLKHSEIRETKTEKNLTRYRIYFEQSVPVPFVPNDKNEMLYWVKTGSDSRKIYRYQLHSGNHLTGDDGIIVLDAISPRLTRYVEIDFFSAEWGLAKTLGAKKIWVDSLKGLIQTDLAFKLSSESPLENPDQIRKASLKLADQYPAEVRFAERISLPAWIKAHELHLEK